MYGNKAATEASACSQVQVLLSEGNKCAAKQNSRGAMFDYAQAGTRREPRWRGNGT
jgi:hypothetical protein